MQTILGAGGPVSNALTKELQKTGIPVRLVSRRKIAATGNQSWMGADLKNGGQVRQAVEGSDVVYLCAGLTYNKKVWLEEWPVIIQHVINAVKETNARLIFFDNVYMYGRVEGVMTEETPYNPVSTKGEVRARVAERLMEEAKAGNIRVSIARAADFYGAESLNSFYDAMVLAKYANESKAMWLGNVNTLHSFTYVPDTAKALLQLGADPAADNQVWHLPTAAAMKGKDFISLAAEVFGVKPSCMPVNKMMLQTLGLFNPMIKETVEMYYQYQYDYVFSSAKFEQAYGIKPTSYAAGVQQFSEVLLAKNLRQKVAA